MRLATHRICQLCRVLSESIQFNFFSIRSEVPIASYNLSPIQEDAILQQFAVIQDHRAPVSLSRFYRVYQMLGQVQLNVWRQFDSNVVNGYCCNVAAAYAEQ